MNYPHNDINYKSPKNNNASILEYAISKRNIKVIDLIINHPNCETDIDDLFSSCAIIGHFYEIKYLIDHYDSKINDISRVLMLRTASSNHFYSLKLILDIFLKRNKEKSSQDIINDFKNISVDLDEYNEKTILKFSQIVYELKPK